QEWNVVVNFERPQGGLGNAIKEEVDFNVRIRGNAKPYPSTVTPLLQESKLNATSYAIAKVHGSGTTTVPCSNPEGGGTYFVDWGSINTPVSSRVGLTTGNYNSANTHFDGIVKLNEAG